MSNSGKIAYKVLQNLESCYARGTATLYYNPGKLTYPIFSIMSHSKIFIFETIKAATNFSNNRNSVSQSEIWKVRAYNCQRPLDWCLRYPYDVSSCVKYWDFVQKMCYQKLNRKRKNQSLWKNFGEYHLTSIPKGTLWCSSLVLLERVS